MIFDLEQFDFAEKESAIRIFFLKIFYFDVDKDYFFSKLSARIVDGNIISDLDIEKVQDLFNDIFSDNIDNLTNKISGKNTIYIHKNSGVPLIGSGAFGIVDRNTNIIEVKPITGCNLKCIYCSLSEGGEDIENEFLIDSDYLFSEVEKVISYKTEDDENKNIMFEIHIGTHGEPLLYFDIAYFAKKIRSIKNINRISINTNAVLLNKKYIDELIESGINRFNISINSIDSNNSRNISGTTFYDVHKVMETIEYIDSLIKSGKYPDLEYTIAPVMMKDINTSDVEDMLLWSKEKSLSARYGIQNFLVYNTGRKPVKMLDFKKFFTILKEWEDKYSLHLVLNQDDYNIVKTKQLPIVAKKDEIIKVKCLFKGRRKNEYISEYCGRIVTIRDEDNHIKNIDKNKEINVKLIRTKHNIYEGLYVKEKSIKTKKIFNKNKFKK